VLYDQFHPGSFRTIYGCDLQRHYSLPKEGESLDLGSKIDIFGSHYLSDDCYYTSLIVKKVEKIAQGTACDLLPILVPRLCPEVGFWCSRASKEAPRSEFGERSTPRLVI
jgi:hypothetical protein